MIYQGVNFIEHVILLTIYSQDLVEGENLVGAVVIHNPRSTLKMQIVVRGPRGAGRVQTPRLLHIVKIIP